MIFLICNLFFIIFVTPFTSLHLLPENPVVGKNCHFGFVKIECKSFAEKDKKLNENYAIG